MHQGDEAKPRAFGRRDLRHRTEGKPVHQHQAAIGKAGEIAGRRRQIARIRKGKALRELQMADIPAEGAKPGC